jgi:alanine racemase
MTDNSSRPTYLEVDLTRLKNNLENIRAHVAPAKVMVVLKGNAYGHGVDGVAPFIAPYADYLGVALVEEGVHLRELGIDKPILVMGGTLPAQIPWFIKYDLTLVASSPELLDSAEEAAGGAKIKLKVHLKIDTGMERIGMHEYEAKDFLQKATACSHLQIEGIYSHFANADAPDLRHARLQMKRFEGVLNFYDDNRLPRPALCHIANSSAVLQLPESYFDMVRPGILFYGVYPEATIARAIEVKPALTWRSRVAFTKTTQAGRPVSYASTWQSSSPVRIVTIPCGYADGYFRRMTNRAHVMVNGKKYPQVGRICMDQFMVNLGEDRGEVGDAVVLLGEGITPQDLARWAGTNEYEVLTNISARVPRLFVQ